MAPSLQPTHSVATLPHNLLLQITRQCAPPLPSAAMQAGPLAGEQPISYSVLPRCSIPRRVRSLIALKSARHPALLLTVTLLHSLASSLHHPTTPHCLPLHVAVRPAHACQTMKTNPYQPTTEQLVWKLLHAPLSDGSRRPTRPPPPASVCLLSFSCHALAHVAFPR